MEQLITNRVMIAGTSVAALEILIKSNQDQNVLFSEEFKGFLSSLV